MAFRLSSQNQNLMRKWIIAFAVVCIVPILFFVYLFVATINFKGRYPVSTVFYFALPFILLLSIAGFFLLFHTLGRIRFLSRNVEDAMNQLGQPQIVPNADEVDKLSGSFFVILDELRRKLSELEKYSDELSKLNRRLVEMTIIDDLTGLYNSRYFRTRLQEEITRVVRYHRTLCLVMIDIDDFKAVNDAYGHLTGDDVLRTLGRLMSSSVRQCDIVARYGGEEFAIILPETGLTEGLRVAERLRRKIAEHDFLPARERRKPLRITASLGIVAHADSVEDIDGLIHRADSFLYRAKRLGKNRIECLDQSTEDQHAAL
jgi:diguanylate cyclase (GGDEF)-like protein